MKVVINKCFGGFSLSKEAEKLYLERSKVDPTDFFDRDICRSDPILIAIVEELKEKAYGTYAELAIVEVPNDVIWSVEEYDGYEHIAEQHRTWG